MTLVPTNFPDLVAARGVPVNVIAGWETRGSSADHDAVCLHHTASSSNESPSSCANYLFVAAGDAPLYNVLVDRYGTAWIGAREKSNNAGQISSVALAEARSGRAGATSAGARGLADDTSANANLFAIAAQNNGTGESWSDELVDGIAVVAAVALECLGIADAGYVTQHRVLTARKIDNCGDACPYDFQPSIAAALGGRGMPEDDMPTGAQTITRTRGGAGYYIVGSDGGVFAYGDAHYAGSIPELGVELAAPIVGLEVTESGAGYWLLAQDGGVFAFGDAQFLGAPTGHVR